MNNKQLETKVRQAFSAAAPDKLDEILRHCDTQKGAIVMMTPNKKTNPWLRRITGVAAAAALVLCGIVYSQTYMVASTVSLDVNPSIQIDVNSRQRVLEVIPLNEDGRAVVGEMDFHGSDLDVAVNALIGSMLRNGYLSEMANAILVSVDDSDAQRAQALQQQLAAEIDALLQTDAFSGAVLSQTVSDDAELDQLARSNNITPGKAQLVRQMANQNSFYSEEELAKLSINDLYLLNSSVDNVASTGQASDKAYIGRDAALEAAKAHAEITSPVTRWEAEMDYDDGRMVYEVEFFANNTEYDYEIDALTGEVLRHEFEPVPKVETQNRSETPVPAIPDTQMTPQEPTDDGRITADEAKMKALVHANLAHYSVDFGMEWELDSFRGRQVYEIDFDFDGCEYEYLVDAVTGEVLKYKKEQEGKPSVEVTNVTPSTTAEDAKQTALTHAGVSEQDIRDYDCELDDGVYEIEFQAGGYEYSYEVDAASGQVLKHEKERDD